MDHDALTKQNTLLFAESFSVRSSRGSRTFLTRTTESARHARTQRATWCVNAQGTLRI